MNLITNVCIWVTKCVVIAIFFFILKIGCMIMNKSIIILKLNYLSFYFKNQTNLIFYALCFETHFFSRTFTYKRAVDMYILKWLRLKSHKNVFYKLNVPEIAGIRKKCASLKLLASKIILSPSKSKSLSIIIKVLYYIYKDMHWDWYLPNSSWSIARKIKKNFKQFSISARTLYIKTHCIC